MKLRTQIRCTMLLQAAALSLLFAAFSPQPAMAQSRPSPVLVELFTSEGCSSCPPADALLAEIAKEAPGLIVLSEHVTYWNQLGWRDPYSLDQSTMRQNDYALRLRLDGPYTPQMVVDGQREFVGSDRRRLVASLAEARSRTKPALSVSLEPGGGAASMDVAINLDHGPAGAKVFAVLVQNEGRQQVARGENGGRTLTHVAIARSFHELGNTGTDGSFHSKAKLALPADGAPAGYHVVVFAQSGRGGPMIAAASTP